MRINEPGHNGLACEVKHRGARADEWSYSFVRAHRDKLSTRNGKAPDSWCVGFKSDDVGVLNHKVGRLSGGNRTNGRARQGEEQGESCKALGRQFLCPVHAEFPYGVRSAEASLMEWSTVA